MNNCTFAGRLGRDAESRDTTNTTVTNFSLAVDEYAGQGNRRTLWVDCSMWGERGEKLAEYLVKGTPVAVSGQVGARSYEKNGETHVVLTLNVREVTLLGSKQDGGEQRQAPQSGGGGGGSRGGAPARQRPATATTPPKDDFADDDIPFITSAGTF